MDNDDLYKILKSYEHEPDNPIFNLNEYDEYKEEVIENILSKEEENIYNRITKAHKNKKYDISKLYEKLFNGKFRIILPVKDIEAEDLVELYRDEFSTIKKVFNNIVKIYFDYYNIKQDINDWQFNAEDFIEGYITNKKTNKKISVGKILNEVKGNKKKVDLNNIKSDLDWFITIFNQRATKKEQLYVVISRHPYDIAGMSTGRGWESCMDIHKGEFNEYVLSSIINGALIAYTVNKNDLNITNPINRLLIKPYIKENEEINFEKPNFVLLTSEIYGAFIPSIENVVREWLDKNWNIKMEKGKYSFDDEIFYNEDLRDYRKE